LPGTKDEFGNILQMALGVIAWGRPSWYRPGWQRCCALGLAYIERYKRTVTHEWLDQYIIESIEEAQHHATQWLWTYNNERPNMGIGG